MPDRNDPVDQAYHGGLKALGEVGNSIMEFFDPPEKSESPEERIADVLEEIAKRDK